MPPKIKPVYNVGDFGQDVFIPLVFGANSTTAYQTTSITGSAGATQIRTLLDSASSIPVDDNELIIMTNDTLGLVNPGNDTAFDQTFSWIPDMNAWIYKTSLQIAFGVNISAFTSGTEDLGTIKVTATERATGRILIPTLTFTASTAQLSATGTAICILMADYTEYYEVKSKSPIDIRVQLTTVKSGTSTRQEGIFPTFCWLKENVIKPFGISGVKFHVHASVNHADPIFENKEDRIQDGIL